MRNQERKWLRFKEERKCGFGKFEQNKVQEKMNAEKNKISSANPRVVINGGEFKRSYIW